MSLPARSRFWLPTLMAWLCVIGFVIALLAYCAPVRADTTTYTARIGDDALTLLGTPCEAGAWMKQWKAARYLYRGTIYEACWRPHQRADGTYVIVILDSEGVVSQFSTARFTKDEGT